MTFVYFGGLSGRIWAAGRRKVVRDHGDGTATFQVIGPKHDVTLDAIEAVIGHVRICPDTACPCVALRQAIEATP